MVNFCGQIKAKGEAVLEIKNLLIKNLPVNSCGKNLKSRIFLTTWIRSETCGSEKARPYLPEVKNLVPRHQDLPLLGLVLLNIPAQVVKICIITELFAWFLPINDFTRFLWFAGKEPIALQGVHSAVRVGQGARAGEWWGERRRGWSARIRATAMFRTLCQLLPQRRPKISARRGHRRDRSSTGNCHDQCSHTK